MIKNITIDWSTFKRQAIGSDNFPMTLERINNNDEPVQITSFGDGYGFGESGGKQSLGFSIIEGHYPSYNQVDISGTYRGKCYGVIRHTNKSFLAAVGSGGSDSLEYAFLNTHINEMSNHGGVLNATRINNWSTKNGINIVLPTFLQGYEDNEWYYLYSANLRKFEWYMLGNGVYCFRIPKHDHTNFNAYEYWDGTKWNKDRNSLKLVVGIPQARTIGACVVPHFNKILLITEHTDDSNSNIAIYQADKPQGPFSTLKKYSSFGYQVTKETNFFTGYLAPGWFKKLSDTAVEAGLVLSGAGENDAFCSVKIKLIGEMEDVEPPKPEGYTIRKAIKTFFIDNNPREYGLVNFILNILDLTTEEIDTDKMYKNIEEALPKIEHCKWMDDELPSDIETILIGLDLILKSGKKGEELREEVGKLFNKYQKKIKDAVEGFLGDAVNKIKC